MTTPTQPHPSFEDLAAFLDGKLEGGERARVIQHLDECPDCYETFAGTAGFLQEEEEAAALAASAQLLPKGEEVLGKQAQGGRVVPFPLGRGGSNRASLLQGLSLAAGMILVAGLAGIGYVSLFAPPKMKIAELLQPIEEHGHREVQIFDWETNRGAGDEPGSSQFLAPPFLIGAWMVDRQVAIDNGKPEPAQDMSRRIYLALESRGMKEEAAPFEKEAKRNLTTRAEREAFLRELRETVRQREESLASDNTYLETDYLALGKWAEAARIAATTQNDRFFESRDNRRLPSYFLKKHGDDLQDSRYSDIRLQLDRAAKTLRNRNLDAAGFKELDSSLDGLIQKFETLADEETGELGMPEDSP